MVLKEVKKEHFEKVRVCDVEGCGNGAMKCVMCERDLCSKHGIGVIFFRQSNRFDDFTGSNMVEYVVCEECLKGKTIKEFAEKVGSASKYYVPSVSAPC